MLEVFEVGFYNKLKGNAALQTKLGGTVTDPKIYHGIVPQGSVLPYIKIRFFTDKPLSTFSKSGAIEYGTFYLNIHSKTSPANVLQIADLVFATMDNTDITVTGYSSLLCERDYTGEVLTDPETGFYQMTVRYRVTIGKN